MLNISDGIPRAIFNTETLSPKVAECDDPPFDCGRERMSVVYSTMPKGHSYRSNFQTLRLDNKNIICYNTLSSVGVLNPSAFQLASHFEKSASLHTAPNHYAVNDTINKMIRFGLLVPEGYNITEFAEDPHQLSAWLHVTNRCNLRCSYCYIQRKNVDMSLERGKAAIDATFRSAKIHGYRKVQFKYAGGEPLLHFPLVVELHHYAQTEAKKENLQLIGGILSNGTCLTAEILETMKFLELELMISLDDLDKSHDCQRSYVNGKGSSIDAVRAIELALKYSVKPYISITVSGQNAEKLPELVKWLLERNLRFRLNFCRANSFSSAVHNDLKLEEDKIISTMLETYKVIEANLPSHTLLDALVDKGNLSAPHLRTCSVGQSSLIFDSLGQVAKCQMQIDKSITTANVKDPLAIVRSDKKGIQNISVEEKEDCRSCEWKYWCTGGCPVVTNLKTGRYDVKSPNCHIYKRLYHEVVRLEGLRLLKYAN